MVIHKNGRATIGGFMGWSADDVELVSIDWLKPHDVGEDRPYLYSSTPRPAPYLMAIIATMSGRP
jgi:hypothetical protein